MCFSMDNIYNNIFYNKFSITVNTWIFQVKFTVTNLCSDIPMLKIPKFVSFKTISWGIWEIILNLNGLRYVNYVNQCCTASPNAMIQNLTVQLFQKLFIILSCIKIGLFSWNLQNQGENSAENPSVYKLE